MTARYTSDHGESWPDFKFRDDAGEPLTDFGTAARPFIRKHPFWLALEARHVITDHWRGYRYFRDEAGDLRREEV